MSQPAEHWKILGRVAATLVSPRNAIAAVMERLGESKHVPSIESDPNSVWKGADRSPTKQAGYFVEIRTPCRHSIEEQNTSVALSFEFHGVPYRIESSRAPNTEANIRLLVLMLEGFEQAVQRGYGAWEIYLLPFRDTRTVEKKRRAWWSVLRLPPDANENELKAAYKRLARKHHSDHGGTDEKFCLIQDAYEEGKHLLAKQKKT